jgi:hypothetical protein
VADLETLLDELVPFLVAFETEGTDSVPFAHETQWSEWTQARLESAP